MRYPDFATVKQGMQKPQIPVKPEIPVKPKAATPPAIQAQVDRMAARAGNVVQKAPAAIEPKTMPDKAQGNAFGVQSQKMDEPTRMAAYQRMALR